MVSIDRWLSYTVPSIDRFHCMLQFTVQRVDQEASSITVMGWTG